MKNIAIILLSITIAFSSCKSSKKGSSASTSSKFNFEKSSSLATVLEKAKQEDKLVFVDFYTSWCMPCKMMDADVFSDKDLARFFNKEFINYKVNCEKGNGPTLATVYEVRNYPTLMFLDQEGNVLVKHIGAAYPTKMNELAENALAKAR